MHSLASIKCIICINGISETGDCKWKDSSKNESPRMKNYEKREAVTDID